MGWSLLVENRLKIGNLSFGEFERQLAGTGITFRSGPFVSCIISELPELAAPLHFLYDEFPVAQDSFVDFHVRVGRTPGLYHRLRSTIVFTLDRTQAFYPFPRRLALPLFEWGMNWCIYSSAHQYLMVHAAVVQKGAKVCMLPGVSGAGKSTLCAALVSRGWRLLSDELAIWRPGEEMILPISRPISLKNDSIELIKAFAPNQTFGPYFGKTAKGPLAHMKPPSESVHRMDELSSPTHIVFPSYQPDSGPELDTVTKKEAFIRISDFALNYPMHGRDGFNSLIDVIETCESYEFRYASLEDAIRVFDDLS